MARIVVLGTAGAVASAEHGHTYFALDGERGFLLIDCGDSPVVRLREADLPIGRMRGVIVTHFHPDHVAGLPVLIVSAWLLGRVEALPLFGLRDVTERFAAMMALFRWHEWHGLYEVPLRDVSAEPGALVLADDDFRITSAPTNHPVPTIGLRIENRRSGRTVAYSADTEPCDEVVTLARGAHILFHEATGDAFGHSSAAQAGTVARRAGVGRLVLVHYPPCPADRAGWLAAASTEYDGPVELAQDYGEYTF